MFDHFFGLTIEAFSMDFGKKSQEIISKAKTLNLVNS